MQFLLKFLLLHLIFYLIGSFVAWDLNPANWFIFTNTVGRISFIGIESIILRISLDDDI